MDYPVDLSARRERRHPVSPVIYFLIAPLVVVSLSTPVNAQTPAIDDLGWMSGCWAAQSGEATAEEQWMAPRNELMLGMGRTTAGDRVSFEFLRIVADDQGISYVAAPSGRDPTTFIATRADERSVEFENPHNDFPQTIRYHQTNPDSLLAEIAGVVNGTSQAVQFPFGRTECPG